MGLFLFEKDYSVLFVKIAKNDYLINWNKCV